MKLAVIGAGKMGLPMAQHFRGAGHDVTVHDAGSAQRDAAQADGFTVAACAAAAVARAEVIVSSLPHDAALLAVAAEVAPAAAPGAVYVDTSTVSLGASREAAALCERHGLAHVRATVSGNNKMAAAAQLTVLASGPRGAYERVLPLLSLLGPSQVYLGAAEEARLMKLVVNLLVGGYSALLGEALTLGEKGGLDWAQMWDVICASAAGAPIIKAKAADLRARDYTPTFNGHQMMKDVNLMLEAGAQLEVPLVITAYMGQLLRAAIAQGDGALDYASMIRATERAAGLKPEP